MQTNAMQLVRINNAAQRIAASSDNHQQEKEERMKVAVVSDDGVAIAAHFGRAQGFVVYTIENSSVTAKDWLPNTFTAHAHGHSHGDHDEQGHGMHGHGPILRALADCDVVISRGMGRRAYDDLAQSGLQVVITGEENVERALSLFLAGQLVDQPQLACGLGQGHEHGHQAGCH